MPPGFPRHNSVSNLKDGFKGLDPKLFFGGGGSPDNSSNANGDRGVDPGTAGADHGAGSEDEYVEEDEDDLAGGPGQDPSAKGKIRKKKTRTVFSRSQVGSTFVVVLCHLFFSFEMHGRVFLLHYA